MKEESKTTSQESTQEPAAQQTTEEPTQEKNESDAPATEETAPASEEQAPARDPNLGTKNQSEVVEEYSTRSKEDKLLVPYIEKYNGNIYANKKDYEHAIMHYNKALFAMKMLFENEDHIIEDQETAVRFIKEIEIPVCNNLALAYLKEEHFHYAIKYATQVIEKQDND